MTKLSLIEQKLLFEMSHFKGMHSYVLFLAWLLGVSRNELVEWLWFWRLTVVALIFSFQTLKNRFLSHKLSNFRLWEDLVNEVMSMLT